MLNSNTFFIFIWVILFTSCTAGKYKDIPIYSVSHSNFENSITIEGFVEPDKTTIISCPRGLDAIITYLVEDGTYVNAGDTICLLEANAIELQYNNTLTDLENLKAGLNKTKADLNLQYALLEAQVETNNVNTKIAEMDSLQLIYAPQNIQKIKELELEKTAIQKRQLDKKLEALNIINQTEIKKLELQIQLITNRLQTVKERLDALIITAPKAGLALRAANRRTGMKNKIGDNVWNLMPIVNIPELTGMKIKIMAPETEYKYISINDSVVYSFDAMPENRAWGKIRMKSPVGTPFQPGSKVKFFEIEASIDSVLTMPFPGYTANCRVILKEIEDTLVVPLIAIFEEDSLKVIYVKNKRGFEMREIATGLSSSKEVIITSGLGENEKIALIKPIQSLINNKILLPADTLSNNSEWKNNKRYLQNEKKDKEI